MERKKKSQHILSSSYTSQQLGFTFQPTPPLATQNAVSRYFKMIKSEFVILPPSITPWHQRCHFHNCTVSRFRELSCPKIRWFRAGQHARRAHLCDPRSTSGVGEGRRGSHQTCVVWKWWRFTLLDFSWPTKAWSCSLCSLSSRSHRRVFAGTTAPANPRSTRPGN